MTAIARRRHPRVCSVPGCNAKVAPKHSRGRLPAVCQEHRDEHERELVRRRIRRFRARYDEAGKASSIIEEGLSALRLVLERHERYFDRRGSETDRSLQAAREALEQLDGPDKKESALFWKALIFGPPYHRRCGLSAELVLECEFIFAERHMIPREPGENLLHYVVRTLLEWVSDPSLQPKLVLFILDRHQTLLHELTQEVNSKGTVKLSKDRAQELKLLGELAGALDVWIAEELRTNPEFAKHFANLKGQQGSSE